MARRKKNRTHVPVTRTTQKDGTPKSFVIKAAGHGHGSVGSSVGMLVKDVRRVMEPNTASSLKERKSNRLRDYIAMAGPLGVTHMMVFSQSSPSPSSSSNNASTSSSESSMNVNLRICRLPRGPTLTFKVLRYSLASDVLSASKRPRSPGKEFATEPLLILNNFNVGEDRELKLMTTMFQNLFPSLKVHTMQLTSARRVVLLSYNPTTRTIEFRHYLITVRPVGVSKAVRKIIEGSNPSRTRSLTPSGLNGGKGKGKQVPNMASANDVADYVLSAGQGFITSDSEPDSDIEVDSDGEVKNQRSTVELPQDFVGRGNKRGDQRAIKLTELGPRMELGLVKVEEGIGDGAVLFHEYIKKSKSETAAQTKRKAEQKALATKRRKEQEANVARKQEEKEAKKLEKAAKRKQDGGEEDEEEDEESEEESEEEEEDMEDVQDGEEGEQEGESELDDLEIERTVFGNGVDAEEEDEEDDFGLGLDDEIGIDSDDSDEEEGAEGLEAEEWSEDSDDEVAKAAAEPVRKKGKTAPTGAPGSSRGGGGGGGGKKGRKSR